MYASEVKEETMEIVQQIEQETTPQIAEDARMIQNRS